ncbi:hypothetical protein MCC10055_0914 [Bifidobacterium longum subsp. longum]|nr:hypothetical protein MCC10055_0914 [Bifidobacterium longum subsp. longum]
MEIPGIPARKLVTLDALWELCQPDNAKSAPSGPQTAP